MNLHERKLKTMWFEKLTGFKEESSENVRKNLRIEGDSFVSKANNKKFTFGKLEIPTLEQLQQSNPPLDSYKDTLQISILVADVMELHCQIENENALFQAASQFNLLEMVGPDVTPEHGIDRYELDHTQGPACAIACGAGTIYRNYFVELDSQIGQTADKQIDCLDLIGKEFQNEKLNLWEMRNGYALASQEGLLTINEKLAELTNQERESLKQKLKVGIQWNTEVTQSDSKHKVSQIYCSALPVSYTGIAPKYWEPFARLILEATYEATLHTALLNAKNNSSNVVYLTLVGGGAFGNDKMWVLESLKKAIQKFKNTPLDVRIVRYSSSNMDLVAYLSEK